MLNTYEEAYAVIAEDPAIDPDVFWPRVGVSRKAADGMGHYCALLSGISYMEAMTILEIGATIAERGIKG